MKPTDIDVLIVNCSLFCPTPSLSAMIVNHFRMRPDVLSYNLGGMGCSAGVIAIGLAEKLLQVCFKSEAWQLNTAIGWHGQLHGCSATMDALRAFLSQVLHSPRGCAL